MAEYELPKRRWATTVTVAFILLIAAAIAALFVFAPKTEAPPQQQNLLPSPRSGRAACSTENRFGARTDADAHAKPTATASSSVPTPKYKRDALNILGKSIWDAFGEDVALVNSGIQTPDGTSTRRSSAPLRPLRRARRREALNIEGSKWVIRVTATDARRHRLGIIT